MTKKNGAMLAEYNRMTATELYDIYNNVSRNKIIAFKECRKLQHSMNGYAHRVKKCGTFFFVYAFKYMKGGQEYLFYMTGRNNYTFPVE